MIDYSKKVVCLTISEKINSVQPIKVCGLNEIDMLVTELSPEDTLLKPYINAGVKVA